MKKSQMKKFFLICIGILIILIIFFLMFNKTYLNLTQEKILKQEENNINFFPYSNKDEILKMLITFKAPEGIETVKYKKGEKEIIINALGKNKISIDYEITENGDYKFEYKPIGKNSIEEILTINDDYRNNLIKIETKIENEYYILDFDFGMYKQYENKQIKIGEKGKWENYTEKIQTRCNNLVDLQNENSTLNIYARVIDKANNEVIIGKTDVAMLPSIPEISAISTQNPIITNYGIKIEGNINIQYEQNENFENYYSIDNGVTWQKYNGEQNVTGSFYIVKAKSINKNTGAVVTSEKNYSVQKGVLSLEAFDNNTQTYVNMQTELAEIRVSQETIGKNINIVFYSQQIDLTTQYIYFKNDLNTTLLTKHYVPDSGKMYDEVITIPEGTTKIVFHKRGHSAKFNIYEIQIANEPSLKISNIYPTLTLNGVEKIDNIDIEYFETSIQKLYKIDEREWQEYTGTTIKLPLEQTLYAKGIDAFGNETRRISTHTPKIPDDSLGIEAYDNNLDTYSELSLEYSQIKVSPEVNGKNINIIFYSKQIDLTTQYIYFRNDLNTTLSTKRYVPDSGKMYDEVITIPEGTTKIVFHKRGHGAKFNIYELNIID